MVMTPLGDRRSQPRFDVVGALWGLLELSEPGRIWNVNSTGALIESPQPAALDSTQTLRVVVDGQPVKVEARVRHVHRADIEPGPRFLIGLEFISPPTSVLQSIEQLSGGSNS